nr:ABC transporter substrate-binding protein [uncultured Desulfobulbus sp.]
MLRVLLIVAVSICCDIRVGVTQDRLGTIETKGILRVCIWPGYYGISFRNPKTNQLSGVDIDMARELAHDLGPHIQVHFEDSSFARLSDDLLSNRCDIAMFAIGITEKRKKTLSFTRPHLQSDIYAITTRSNRRVQNWQDIDQPGVVVAVVKGTLHEPLMRKKLKHATLEVLDTPFAREQEVESGRADVFMTDYPYSRRMLAHSDWARLVAPPKNYHITPYAYALAPGDEPWMQRVEQFVAQSKADGRLLAICKRHHLAAMARLD